MSKLRACIVALLVVSVLAAPCRTSITLALETDSSSGDFKPLIDTVGFGSWRPRAAKPLSEFSPGGLAETAEVGMGCWRNTNGELSTDSDGPGLESQQSFGDFEIRFEAIVEGRGTFELLVRDCPHLQLSAGDAATESPVKSAATPLQLKVSPGAWIAVHCRMVGSYLSVSLDGKEIARNVIASVCSTKTSLLPPAGNIALRGLGGKVRIRDFSIREIPAGDATEILANLQGDESEFRSLFNGRDLAGWIGAVNNYEVTDGTLRCRAGRGGNLVTAEQFDDFVVRLEFRLPPGGNNGLALRAPNPDGVPGYDGIEIQVLDDTAEVFAALEPYQYNGSAYGLKAAHRGYLRPVGSWNYEEIVVDEDRIRVQLNGYEILDADLATLRDAPIDGKDHPGAHRTRGHFGFCGHSDPVEFRNIRIKPID